MASKDEMNQMKEGTSLIYQVEFRYFQSCIEKISQG